MSLLPRTTLHSDSEQEGYSGEERSKNSAVEEESSRQSEDDQSEEKLNLRPQIVTKHGCGNDRSVESCNQGIATKQQ